MLSKLEVIEKGYLELKSKCDRYEKALKSIRDFYPSSNIQPDKVANEALKGEGESVTDADIEFMKECNLSRLTDGGLIIRTENDEGARLTKDDLLKLSSIIYRYANQKEDNQ
jgi:hypothetical protein